MKREEIEGLLDGLAYIFTSQEEERKIKAKLLAYVEEREIGIKGLNKTVQYYKKKTARLEKVMRESDDILRPLMPSLSLYQPHLALEISKVRMKIQQALAESKKEKHDTR